MKTKITLTATPGTRTKMNPPIELNRGDVIEITTLNPALEAFRALVEATLNGAGYARKITIKAGKKYAKLIEEKNGRDTSVHSFVDLTTGDILKPASWKAPAKHARGNILNADGGAEAIYPTCHHFGGMIISR